MTLEELRDHNVVKDWVYVKDVDHLVNIDDRESYAINQIFEVSRKGQTNTTLQQIFRIEMTANATLTGPAEPETPTR